MEGYAECPDCGSRIHCGSVGLANLEKRHRGTKICWETKAKQDKNAKAKKNGSLLTFFNHPKATPVPSTILRVQPVHSPALTQETVEAAVPHRDEQIAPVRTTTRPKISPFLERLNNLAKSLPHTIPEASDNDKLAEFGGDPAGIDDKTIDSEELWEEEINPRLKRILGWGTEGKMEDLIRRGRKGVEGLAIYVRYCVEERGVNEGLFEGKLSHLMSVLEETYVLKIICDPMDGTHAYR